MAFEQLHTRVCNTSVARLSFTILIVTQQQSREINLYDADGNLVDRLTYGDNTLSGSIRAQNNSGNPESLDVLGMMRWAGSPLLLAMSTALTWRPIVVVEERPRDAYVLTYTAAAYRARASRQHRSARPSITSVSKVCWVLAGWLAAGIARGNKQAPPEKIRPLSLLAEAGAKRCPFWRRTPGESVYVVGSTEASAIRQ